MALSDPKVDLKADPQLPRWWRRVSKLSLVAPVVCALLLVRHVISAPTPFAAPPSEQDTVFGVPITTCRTIYDEVSGYETHWRTLGASSFPNHPWSQEDDYRNIMRRHVHIMEPRVGLHYSQIFWCIDHGLRSHWRRPNGDRTSIPPEVSPLKPRTE